MLKKMVSLSSVFSGVVVAAVMMVSPGAAWAVNPAPIIEPGTYNLHNHPDGDARPPLYGMRLDGLTGSGIHTFDFDHPDASMTLTYDGSSIHITGTTYGGLNSGSGYADVNTGKVGLWQVDFTYYNVSVVPGDDDLYTPDQVQVNDVQASNGGTITKLFGDQFTYDLVDMAMGGYSFRLGDEDNDNGHRGFQGISGWGWMNHYIDGQTSPTVHIAASDWLFTMDSDPNPQTDVPEPASLAMIGLGLAALMRRPSRRRQAA